MFCALLQVLKDQLAFRLCGGLSIMTKLLQLLHDENIVHLYPKYVSYLYPNLWIPPALKLCILFVSKRWIPCISNYLSYLYMNLKSHLYSVCIQRTHYTYIQCMYSNFVLNFNFIKSWRLRNHLYSPAIERNTILTLSLITEIRQLAALMISYVNLCL